MAATREVYVCGRPVALHAASAVGTGGEADVYSIGGGLALKVYKSPDHPDLQSPNAQERAALQAAARERLDVAQRKLRVFPRNLPTSILGPEDLAYEGPGKGARAVGYTMPYLEGADLLYQYGQRKFREDAGQSGLTPERVREVLLDLHNTVEGLHTAGVVIGDFNDLNVLARSGKAFLVDADSFQYGGFLCRTFQYRFVDPLICDPRLDHLELSQPHTEQSDWYAYSVMTLRCLLYVDPYSGLYRPKGKSKIPEPARPLHRITIFSPDVQYPRPAIPFRALPDDLLEYFRETFERDLRGRFPLYLLDGLRWSRCPACGAEHARPACPWCQSRVLVQVPVPQSQTLHGDVAATLVFSTEGRVVAAAIWGGRLAWLYEQGGDLRREDGTTVLRGGLARDMRVRLSGSTTHIAQGANLASLRPGQPPERRVIEAATGAWSAAGAFAIPAFAANSAHLYWIEGDRLYRDSALGPYALGDVLPQATRIWAGERFGLGYYRAGGLEGALLFDAARAGMNDRVDLSLPPGQVLDATCAFGEDRCWFLAAVKEPRGITNHCVLVARDGRVLGRHSAPEGDGSWLGTLRGKCAAGAALLCATDDGVTRVEEVGGALVQTRLFAGTAPYVDSATHLFAGRDGLYAVSAHTIYLLRLGSPGRSISTL